MPENGDTGVAGTPSVCVNGAVQMTLADRLVMALPGASVGDLAELKRE